MTDQLDSHEIMKWLDDNARARFVALQELFESAGWPLVKEFAQGRAFAAGVAGANADDWHKHGIALGQRMTWDEVAAFEDAYVTEFSALADQARTAHTEDVVDDDTDFQ